MCMKYIKGKCAAKVVHTNQCPNYPVKSKQLPFLRKTYKVHAYCNALTPEMN